MKLPYMQFYCGDYLRDSGVRSVSLAARGLWMDLLCFMHQSSRSGFLQHPNGTPCTNEQIARMVGHSCHEVTELIGELDASGVFSRTVEGTIYSRRMVSDERKRAACTAAGKRGGNPLLKRGLSNTLNQGDKVQSQNQNQKEDISLAKANSSSAGADDAGEKIPCLEVFELFARTCISLPKLKDRSDSRRNAIRGRWKAALKAGQVPVAWFTELFAAAEASDFISGRTGRAAFGFDWLLKPANARKVLEGNYTNSRPAASANDHRSSPPSDLRANCDPADFDRWLKVKYPRAKATLQTAAIEVVQEYRLQLTAKP